MKTPAKTRAQGSKASGKAVAASSKPATKAAAKPKAAAKAPAKTTAKEAAKPAPKAAPAKAPEAKAAAPKASAATAKPAPAKTAAPAPVAAPAAAAKAPAPAKPAAPPAPVAAPEPPRAAVPPPVPRGAPVSLPPPTHRPTASPLTAAAASRSAPRGKEDFKTGDHVVYPTHGVGQVQGIETIEAAGYSLQVIVVTFEENRMTLRVPVNKAASSGLRKLAAGAAMQQALDTLKGRARIKRTMWSRRAQEYEAKINSGDPIQIAEVVRDLHRNAGQPDQSFSERQIYEQALDRLAAEVAAIDKSDKAAAIEKLLTYLGKAEKGEKADKTAKAED